MTDVSISDFLSICSSMVWTIGMMTLLGTYDKTYLPLMLVSCYIGNRLAVRLKKKAP